MEIPNKLYFNIGEVSSLTGLEAHVLRFWESEINELHPKKTRSGRRAYRKKDIEMILEIKDLLYVQMFTIQGARRQLQLKKKGMDLVRKDDQKISVLKKLKGDLCKLRVAVQDDQLLFSNPSV